MSRSTSGMRRLAGTTIDLTDEERAEREKLRDEFDALEAEYAEADELPDKVDTRLGEIEEALEAFEARPMRYDADQMAKAGAFVSIRHDGQLAVERGYVRADDEAVDGQEATHHGHYYHEYCMSISVERDSPTGQDMTADAEETIIEALRDLARWLYRQLEREYDYLSSDDVVDETIVANGYTFTEADQRFG